jgi:hypothetical protein
LAGRDAYAKTEVHGVGRDAQSRLALGVRERDGDRDHVAGLRPIRRTGGRRDDQRVRGRHHRLGRRHRAAVSHVYQPSSRVARQYAPASLDVGARLETGDAPIE